MSLSNNVIEIFEQLPSLPLTKIAANVDNFHDLVKLSFKSEKWRCAIGLKSQTRKIDNTSCALKIDKNHCEVSTTDYSKSPEGDERTFILVSQDNLDIHGDNVIRISGNCYHQNVTDGFRFVYTKIPQNSIPRLEMIDAKWVADLLKPNSSRITINSNQFKTRDLRMFVLHWSKTKSCYLEQQFTFQMSQEQVEELDMKEVVKDLSAVPWDPKRRDRKWLAYDSEGICEPIDLADAFDFCVPKEQLATIYLDPETRILHIFKWECKFFIEQIEGFIVEMMIDANTRLAKDDLTPEKRLQNEGRRKKHLQSIRNIREDQNLDFTDVVEEQRRLILSRLRFYKDC